MTCGIYCIENLINKKKYIGQAVNIEKRINEHRKGSKSSKILQRSIKKYGIKNFNFFIIQELELDKEKLSLMETYWIVYFDSYFNGYNLTFGDENMLGYKHSREAKEKISKANSGENHYFYGKHISEETKQKISNSNKGKIISEETRLKMSISNRGSNNSMYNKHHSNESKEKMSNSLSGENHYLYGKHLSDETKRKISKTEKGKIISEEVRKKISDGQKGKHHSEKTRQKMSNSSSGEKNANRKLTLQNVLKIKKMIEENISIKIIAEAFNVKSTEIYRIKNGKRWKNAIEKYWENKKEENNNEF